MSKELEKLKKQRDEFWRNTEIDEIFGIPQDYIENSITYNIAFINHSINRAID